MSEHHRLVVAAAREWLGTPYRHQCTQQGIGCDCLGLVRGVWRRILGEEPFCVPPYAQFGKDPGGASLLLNAAQNMLVPLNGALMPGAVVLFQIHKKIPPRHCGILIDKGRFIHAQERLGVIELALDKRWQRRVHSTYAFPIKV
ncbi:MAG TPA: peptidase [Devosia sp.]|nr:peptidase [Devosia sp.]